MESRDWIVMSRFSFQLCRRAYHDEYALSGMLPCDKRCMILISFRDFLDESVGTVYLGTVVMDLKFNPT